MARHYPFKDRLRVEFPTIPAVLTKRGVLADLAKFSGLTGIVGREMAAPQTLY